VDAALETNSKYNYIREQQLERNKGRVPLMPGERQPTLPSLDQLVTPEYVNPARSAPPPPPAAPAPALPEPTTPFGETPAPPPTEGKSP
jgi:hypothetical protein